MLEIIDYWVVDIKDWNNDIYSAYTGKDNSRVKANLKYLISRGISDKIMARVPAIPEYIPSIEGANDQGFFCEDDGCPSQPINKEEKPNLFDEIGGIPAPESDDWDDEDKNEKEISSDERCEKNFFEKFFQLQGFSQMMTMIYR